MEEKTEKLSDSNPQTDSANEGSNPEPGFVGKRASGGSGDEEKEEFYPKLKLRRCRSTSKAETIVTEEEKMRRAQPDKPIHKPSDSIFSWSSGFQNFEGMVNWAFLLLTMGGVRLGLENLNKYGIRVDPTKWFNHMFGNLESGNNEYPTLFMLLFTNVPVLTALFLERLLAANWISWKVCKILHFLNLTEIMTLPIFIINYKYEYIGPLNSTIVCSLYVIVFLKMWSYAQVNYWCRKMTDRQLNRRGGAAAHLANRARHPSLFDLGGTASNKMIARRGRTTTISGGLEIVQYPENLTVKDIYYFWFAPTLCYELNFPRSNRIRKIFLLRRFLEVVIGTNLVLALIQQWIIPSVVNSLLPFSNMNWSHATERLLKLALPNHLIWLTWFYLLFHSFLNSMGEVMQFADRNFYSDWWNANNIVEFWKMWNLPVHKWCVRHLYKPLVGELGTSRITAMVVVFIVSAVLHEYCVSVPLRMFKIYAFLGMMLQVPLMYLSVHMQNRWSPRFGNILVWLSLIIGQPLAVMMYYHDFVIEHYGKELIESYGKLK